MKLPGVPALSTTGSAASPVVLLIGGRNGSWQRKAIVPLGKVVRTLITTDAPRVHPSEAYLAMTTYLSQADLIVIWCGIKDDGLYLDEWLWAAFAVAQSPHKLVAGIERDHDHPMAPALGYLLKEQGVGWFPTLADTLALAHERCRHIREERTL